MKATVYRQMFANYFLYKRMFTCLDEKSCGSGMTTFSKSERKEGRKPSNLLNALDRADRFPRDDVAEEVGSTYEI